MQNYKGIKVLHIYNAHYFQEKTKFEKVAKMLHNYRVSVIIDVQHYRTATRCTTIRLIYIENNLQSGKKPNQVCQAEILIK